MSRLRSGRRGGRRGRQGHGGSQPAHIETATGKPIYTVSSGALASGRQYSTNDLRSRYLLKFGVRTSF